MCDLLVVLSVCSVSIIVSLSNSVMGITSSNHIGSNSNSIRLDGMGNLDGIMGNMDSTALTGLGSVIVLNSNRCTLVLGVINHAGIDLVSSVMVLVSVSLVISLV